VTLSEIVAEDRVDGGEKIGGHIDVTRSHAKTSTFVGEVLRGKDCN
jgi:hypothetical protein